MTKLGKCQEGQLTSVLNVVLHIHILKKDK